MGSEASIGTRNERPPRSLRTGVPYALALAAALLAAASTVSPARAAERPSAGAAPDGPARVAADTVVVVVSPDAPVTEMSRLHLADLYLGRTSRFPGGEPAEPIDQEPGAPTREAFYEGYLGRSRSEIKAHWSKAVFTGRGRPPRDVTDGEAVRDLVAEDPGTIGYIDADLVDESVRVVRVRARE